MRSQRYKRTLQTIIYFHVLSWVILVSMLVDILSPPRASSAWLCAPWVLNPVYWLGDPQVFPYTLVLTETWKEFGFGTIVYLAALTAIDPNLYGPL